MIDGLKPYPEMRPSGLPWLGDVPAHWETRRIKTLLTEVDSRSKYGRERLLSLRMRHGLVDHLSVGGKPIPPESLIGFKNIEVGQIVMNRMRAAYGLFGIASSEGLVSPDYAVFAVKNGVHAQYIVEAFKMPSLGQIFRAESKGLGTGEAGFLRLYTDRFGRIEVPYPPVDEQRLIMRFLNWHGSQTAKLIRAKQSLLRLAAEKRNILTQDVVSLPETQWLRLDRVVHQCFRNVVRSDRSEFVPVGLYNRGRGIFLKRPTPGNELGDSTFSWIEKDDFILSGQFAWEGAVALAGVEQAGCIASHRYHIIRARENIADVRYLSSLFRSDFGNFILNQHSRGAAGRNRPLNLRTLLKEPIPVPNLHSCSQLTYLINTENEATASIQKSIEVLREFRSQIVFGAITGKLDVRSAAASLPALSETDPADALTDDDDLDDAADVFEDEEVAT